MKTILVIQAAQGPDYLADMIAHFFYVTYRQEARLFTNSHPLYLFDDYPANVDLYGKGFSVYRKIPSEIRHGITLQDNSLIVSWISKRKYSKIAWTSVRRNCSFLEHALRAGYSKHDLVLIDGEDDTIIPNAFRQVPIPSITTYYKRELTDEGMSRGAKPISFKFPSINTVYTRDYRMDKNQILATCDPRFTASYIYNSELDYYQGYGNALFAFTTKKAGWDCLRHYEILACGCLPVFVNIKNMPKYTMVEWDRALQIRANDLWMHFCGMDYSSVAKLIPTWVALSTQFKQLFRNRMLTDDYSNTLDL